MANGNKLIDQKAIDTIIDSILKAVEIKSNKKSSEGRGKDGKDGRDGKDAPQINDDEALSTNPWSGLKTQEEIAKVEGKIYPCTAQALEAMSQEQQAELYVQGYRAIKTENNGTVVLLGLSADGSLEWLGCDQPRGNLLGNPNFAVAQAGYGGLHGAQKYAADRWQMTKSGLEVNESDDGITFTSDGSVSYVYALQLLGDGKEAQGKNVTFFVETDSGDLLLFSSVFPTTINTFVTSQAFTNGMSLRLAVSSGGVSSCVLIFPSQTGESKSVTIKQAGLLYGNYTAKTLPPLEKPSEVTALSDCLYFYRRRGLANAVGIGSSVSQIRAFVDFTSNPMRIGPTTTVTQAAAVISGEWVEASSVTIVGTQPDGVVIGMNFDSGGVTTNDSYLVRFAADFSSDL